MNQCSPLGQEWTTLQNNYEQYEKDSLRIKLTGVIFCGVGLALGFGTLLIGAVLLILWLMEGIFKTYQSRLGTRLLQLEDLLRRNPPDEAAAYQFHSAWLASRPGSLGLVAEYLASAARPTVAFPYVALLLAALML